MIPDELAASDRAVLYLEALRAELARRGVDADLVTSGCLPRLRLVPGAYGDAFFDDHVLAAETGGRWMFWWPFIEAIGPADDPAAAADTVVEAACRMSK